MSRKPMVLMLLAAFVALPAATPAAEENCRLADDRPAYVCSGAGNYRVTVVQAAARGLHVGLLGFEWTGRQLPDGTTAESGACLSISTVRSYLEWCGLPFDVSIDPLLETATIKGSLVDRRRRGFGRIVVDVTVDASGSDVQAYPAPDASGAGGCADASAGSGGGDVYRRGVSRGTVSVGRTRVPMRGEDALVFSRASAGGDTAFAAPCFPARDTDYGFGAYACYGLGVDDPDAGACGGSALVREASVTGRTGRLTLRVVGIELTAPVPDIDPSSVDPGSVGPAVLTAACILVRVPGVGAGYTTCNEPGDFEIDPVLRTARIKGRFISPFDEGLQAPASLDYGRISVDLTLQATEPVAHPDGRSGAFAGAECDEGVVLEETTLLSSPAVASGHVSFKRRYRPVRGTGARPLAAFMDARVATVATWVIPPLCPRPEEGD